MKKLVAVLFLLVTACRPDEPPPLVETAPLQAAPTPAAAAPAATELFTVTAGQTAFPAPFIGVWDTQVDWCSAEHSDARLTIADTTMKFWESDAVVVAITPVSMNVVDVDAKFTGEGETWDARLRMELAGEANSLIITNDGKPFTRAKCP